MTWEGRGWGGEWGEGYGGCEGEGSVDVEREEEESGSGDFDVSFQAGVQGAAIIPREGSEDVIEGADTGMDGLWDAQLDIWSTVWI